MSYQLVCEAATSVPVITGTAVDACTAVGGTVVWVESVGLLPDLTQDEGLQLGVAILGLWAVAFCLRQFRKTVEQS